MRCAVIFEIEIEIERGDAGGERVRPSWSSSIIDIVERLAGWPQIVNPPITTTNHRDTPLPSQKHLTAIHSKPTDGTRRA